MTSNLRASLLPLFTLLAALVPAQAKPAAPAKPSDKIDFAAQVWPILEKSCVECHAAPHVDSDGKRTRPKGNVVLDGKDGITTSKKGKLVVASKPGDSLLYEAITRPADAKKRMPPAKKADPLAKEQIEIIRKWIEQGAHFGTWTGKAEDKDDHKDEKAKDDKKADRRGDAAGGKPKGKGGDDKGKSGDGKSGA